MANDENPLDPKRLAAVLRPISEARGLPNEAYTSERYFAYERERIIGGTWAGLAFTDALPARTSVQPVDFMGLPLLITRDRAGTLRVFHNVCSHRGMKLVAQSAEIPGLISCRYHSWSYALNGELKATPHVGGVNQHRCPGFDPALHGLKAVRSAEFLGVLFVNLSGDAPPFEEHIAPLKRRAEAFVGSAGWAALRAGASGADLSLEVRSNWKLAVENYCEAYHLPFVHPALNTYSKLEDHYCFMDERDFSGQGSSAYRLADIAGIRLPRLKGWPTERMHVAEYPSLYPNVLLGFQADHAFAIILTPLAPDRTREEVRIFYVDEGATSEAYAACRDSTHKAWREVFQEDVFAVEGMQAGRASPGYQGGVFSPAMDAPTHHFHRWVAQRLVQ